MPGEGTASGCRATGLGEFRPRAGERPQTGTTPLIVIVTVAALTEVSPKLSLTV